MTYKQIFLRDTLRGQVSLPASKSISNRVLLLNQMNASACHIHNLSKADDTVILNSALQTISNNVKNYVNTTTIDIGAAGTAMRFLTAYLATQTGTWQLTGTTRMSHRPIAPLVDALRQLGADIRYREKEGFPPLEIHGTTLHGATVQLPANISSQYISALLMIAPLLYERDLILHLEGNITSRPYIDMTLALMREFNADARWEDSETLSANRKPYSRSTDFTIENDWSAASYWYALVALSPDTHAKISLPDLSRHSLQGDARVAQLFKPLGVDTCYTDTGITLTKCTSTSKPLNVDLTGQPDLAQTLIATCAMLNKPFRLTGLHSLRIKETDRITAMQTEIQKLGIHLDTPEEGTLTYTPSKLPATHFTNSRLTICTYQDHRMAMSLAPCAYRFPGLCIEEPDVVSKSYPHFWKELKQFEQ